MYFDISFLRPFSFRCSACNSSSLAWNIGIMSSPIWIYSSFDNLNGLLEFKLVRVPLCCYACFFIYFLAVSIMSKAFSDIFSSCGESDLGTTVLRRADLDSYSLEYQSIDLLALCAFSWAFSWAFSNICGFFATNWTLSVNVDLHWEMSVFGGFWVAATVVLLARPGKEIYEFEQGDFLKWIESNPIIDLAILFRWNVG